VRTRTTRILALVPYPLNSAPGQRYRIEQWRPYLREEGIDIQCEPFADAKLADVLYRRGHYSRKVWHMSRAYLRRLAVVRRTTGFDGLYLFREAALVGPAWLERLARRRIPRLIYDFDDAIWLPYVSPSNRWLSYLKAVSKTASICGMADEITVGNETLADYARKHNPRVTVVPSTVSLRDYQVRPWIGGAKVPVIGWTGSHSSRQYLRLVEEPLRVLARRRPFRLLVVGLEGYRLEGVEVECRSWTAQTEVEDLWRMDVGIMPLFDDAWAQGKCAMKAIQYMGVGVPAVVSPVGANRTVVEDRVTGLHATSSDEWVEALDRLLSDDGLRRAMGARARSRVERHYSAEAQVPRVAALFKGPDR
jgi:glycosyltransferase involved in cell wall biosynthesis